ncbi:MAG: 50S ribosomal protein L17 [Bdellovibrionales bacterium]|nr:50S ribosomal protein L17 [Bdellovibrionales bacterium]
MNHNVSGRKFGRNTSHRNAMLKNLGNNLIKQEQIVTTIQKAKEARRVTEKLITLAKRDTLNARRLCFDRTRDQEVVAKLFTDLVKRYEKRNGGYTRIVKISETRWGDAAKMCLIELVDGPKLDRKKKVKASDKPESDTEATGVQATDPFSKMRKVFGGGKKTAKKDAAPKAEKANKAATTKKAPAAKKKTGDK